MKGERDRERKTARETERERGDMQGVDMPARGGWDGGRWRSEGEPKGMMGCLQTTSNCHW